MEQSSLGVAFAMTWVSKESASLLDTTEPPEITSRMSVAILNKLLNVFSFSFGVIFVSNCFSSMIKCDVYH